MTTSGIIDHFMGYKIIATEHCCDYVQARESCHYFDVVDLEKDLQDFLEGRLVPKKEIVVANCGADKFIFCHPKYWDKFQKILNDYIIGL